MSNLNLPWSNLRSFPLVLLLVTWEKRPTPTSLHSQVAVESNEVSPQPPLLQNEQPQLPRLLLIRLFSRPLPSLAALLWTCSSPSMSFLWWGAQNWTQHSRCSLTSTEYRGTITALLLLATPYLIPARMPLAFLATWAHCWLMLAGCQPTPPGPFPPASSPATLPQPCCIARGCCDPRAGPGTWPCCWTSHNSPHPIDRVCPDRSAEPSFLPADRHSNPTWCHQQTRRPSKRLQIDRRQKELAWKAVAQPHLPMALLAQRHRDWGCLLVLPPQTSNVA